MLLTLILFNDFRFRLDLINLTRFNKNDSVSSFASQLKDWVVPIFLGRDGHKKRNEEVVEEIPWDVVSASSILKTRSKSLKVRTKIKSDLNFTFQEQCQGIFLEPDRTQSISCDCALHASNVGMVKTLDGIYILRSKCQNRVVKLAWAKRNQEHLSQVTLESWPKPKDCASCKAMLTVYNCTIVESKQCFYFDSHCRSCIALEKKGKKSNKMKTSSWKWRWKVFWNENPTKFPFDYIQPTMILRIFGYIYGYSSC